MYACMHACMHVYTYIHIYTHTHTSQNSDTPSNFLLKKPSKPEATQNSEKNFKCHLSQGTSQPPITRGIPQSDVMPRQHHQPISRRGSLNHPRKTTDPWLPQLECKLTNKSLFCWAGRITSWSDLKVKIVKFSACDFLRLNFEIAKEC